MHTVDQIVDANSSMESSNVFENTPINRFRTAIMKVENLKRHDDF